MSTDERLRAELGAAVSGAGSARTAADRLCEACVGLLDVDGASLSLALQLPLGPGSHGTLGASGELSRQLDELQFTFGEGPCLDAISSGRPVLVADLDDPGEDRWPAFSDAVLAAGVLAVFAIPVSLARSRVGALDLFRRRRGGLDTEALAGGLIAAELATLPLLDLLAARVPDEPAGAYDAYDGSDAWAQLASLDRVEVYQATGMVMGALRVDAAEALVRLRARAYALGQTAGQVAVDIVERRISLSSSEWAPLEPGA